MVEGIAGAILQRARDEFNKKHVLESRHLHRLWTTLGHGYATTLLVAEHFLMMNDD